MQRSRQIDRRYVLRIAMLLLGIIVAVRSPAAAAGKEGVYSVGVSSVDVTPSYPVRLNGFGFRRTESEGVTQPVFAKALAIGTDAEKPVILITLDNLGIRLPQTEEVARRLKEKAGIDRERLIITFTHTHTAPKVINASETIFSQPIPPEHQAHIDQYTKDLTDALVKVSLEALANRKPSRLLRGTGEVRFAMNRRTPGGPVDHSLPMLVVRSADDDSIRAIYVTYACHCVTLSLNKISGDWAGYAQEAIQRNHPGAIAMVSIGCGSDANPTSGVTGDNIAAAAEQGDEIAKEVERLLKGELEPISGKLSATYETIDLPLNDLPSREQLEATTKDEANGYNARYQLAKLDRGEKLQSVVKYPIQSIQFGDQFVMLFLGGEVCVDYAIRIGNEFEPGRVWVHGYTNDFCSYIPSERLLKEGGYGGGSEINYFALPTTLKAGLEDQIMREVHRQVPDEFGDKQSGQPNDAAAVVESLVDGLAVGTPAEYDRIPDIWRAAIEAGKRNDTDELRRLLEASIPELSEPATHWQVVVCGGGIINGLTQVGVWPRPRLAEIIAQDSKLMQRCQRMIELSSEMAEDESVRSGTRYDALRILGVDEYDNRGEQLENYLDSEDAELQMGAVSGLGDMQNSAAAQAILDSFGQYNETNRKLAVEALMRDDSRRSMLRDAVKSGKVPSSALSPDQTKLLKAE